MRISDWSSDVCSSDLIADAVDEEGLIARFGGDEFLVICTIGDDPARPGRIADAILDAFGDSFRFDKEEFTITASIGRPEESRVGKGGVRTCRSRRSPDH